MMGCKYKTNMCLFLMEKMRWESGGNPVSMQFVAIR